MIEQKLEFFQAFSQNQRITKQSTQYMYYAVFSKDHMLHFTR